MDKSELDNKKLSNEDKIIEWKINSIRPMSNSIVENGIQIYLTNTETTTNQNQQKIKT